MRRIWWRRDNCYQQQARNALNGDLILTSLGLEVVKHPGVLERGLAHLGSLLLVLLDGTLVDTTALVDQVTSGGGLAGIDVADDHQGNVNLILGHVERVLG